MKDSVKILFIGDEGVGKSSLLSTFISRHFPQEVPSVVSDTIIPSDAVADGVCVTIMDSSARMADREALRAKVSLADTIIFLHDVSRPETFDSIVHLWIPLVKDVVQSTRKPYLLLGTKVDLVNINEDEESDEMLNEILAEYPDFDIFGSCMCSSLRLQNIDNVIKVAFTNVLHPVLPLFDPQNELTSLAYQAFSRIFRILDEDGDNLLNDEDMTALHYYCFSESIDLDATDLVGLKKLLESRNPESLSENGDVTFIGFTEYCKSSLEQERLHVPWTILRHYHYDDDLNIQIPPAVLTLPKLKKGQSYRLSDHAIRFLLITARNAFEENTRAIKSATDSDSTSEVEDCLTSAALKSIFAILPREHYEDHPWLNPPHYQSVWPYDTRRIDPIEQFTLLNKFPHDNANLSFDAWLIHWNTLAFSEPVLVQKYLFLLGYVDRPDFGITVQSGNIYSVYKQRQEQAKSSNYFWKNQQTSKTISTPRSLTYPIDTKVPIPPEVRPRSAGGPKRKHMINICILGDNDVGKSSFAWLFSGLRLPGRNNPFFIEDEIVEKSIEYEKPYETIVIGGSMLQIEDELATSLSRTNLNNFTIPGELRPSPLSMNPNNQGNGKVVYFSISSIPMEHVDVWREKSIHQYDIIFLMFSCNSRKSVDTVLALEKQLPSNIPRHYLCNKMDLLQTPMQGKDEIHQIYEENAERISLHTKEHDLLPFTPISNLTGEAITEVVPIIKELYRRPEGGIKKEIKHVKTWKENFWQFLFNPIGSIFSSTSNIDDDERLGRVGLFTPSSVVLMTGFALLGVFGGSYFLAQYNSTVRFYYQQMMKDVQTWINLTTTWLNGLTLTFPAAFQLSNRKDGNRTSDQHAVRGGVNGDSWSTYLAETMTWLTKK